MPRILQRLDRIFREHHRSIGLAAALTLAWVAFLDYEVRRHSGVLDFWLGVVVFCINEVDYFGLALVVLAAFMLAAFAAVVFFLSTRPLAWLDDFSKRRARKWYCKLLFLRLLVEIDTIEEKYLRGREDIRAENFVLARGEMQVAVARFRRDATRFLTPGQAEVALPAEELYSLPEEDVRAVRRSRYFRSNIVVDEDVIRRALNP